MRIKHLFPIILSVFMISSCGNVTKKAEPPSETMVIARSSDENDHIRLIIENFRLESKYSVEVKCYSSSDLLTTALLGGEQIDVIYADKNIDVSPLAGKGLLTDLAQCIDENEYVRSVLDAMKQNGKLYEIPYDFDVESAVTKKKLWNGDSDTSFEHISEKANAIGCKIPFDYTMDSYGFISFIMSKYVDFENKTCSFDSDDFKKLIEFMKSYNRSVSELTNEQLYDAFKNDDMLVMATGFSSFDQLNYLESDVGDEIEFIGFPSDEENFHIAVPRSTFSIVDCSTSKNEAVKFVKKCVSYDSFVTTLPDGQKIVSHSFSLPINSEALQFCYDQCFTQNSFSIPEDIRKYNVDEIMRQINTISYVSGASDSKIKQIITDELSAYFVGNKAPETVCQSIQSRCMIFLDEQYN